MKVETVRTTTLYLPLAASELALFQANSWQELPPLSHDLVFYPAPNPGPAHLGHEDSEELGTHASSPQVLARIQLRVDCLSGFELRTTVGDALELRVPSGEIAEVNRYLVGPVVLLEDLAPRELWTPSTAAGGRYVNLTR